MNALQLVNKVLREKLGLGDELGTLAGAVGFPLVILWAINEIQRELVDVYDWTRLKKAGTITLVNGTSLYSLASDCQRVIKDKDNHAFYYQINSGISTSAAQITLVDDSIWKDHVALDTTTGKPYLAREFGVDASGYRQVQFYYAPDTATAGTIVYYDYIRRVTDLTNNTDISLFDDHWLIEGAYLKLQVRNGLSSDMDVTDYINSIVRATMQDSARLRKLQYRDT